MHMHASRTGDMGPRYDWLLQFEDGKPAMGWENYLSYLVTSR